eukprot:6476454-Amphidinium_carterae.1
MSSSVLRDGTLHVLATQDSTNSPYFEDDFDMYKCACKLKRSSVCPWYNFSGRRLLLAHKALPFAMAAATVLEENDFCSLTNDNMKTFRASTGGNNLVLKPPQLSAETSAKELSKSCTETSGSKDALPKLSSKMQIW